LVMELVELELRRGMAPAVRGEERRVNQKFTNEIYFSVQS